MILLSKGMDMLVFPKALEHSRPVKSVYPALSPAWNHKQYHPVGPSADVVEPCVKQ